MFIKINENLILCIQNYKNEQAPRYISKNLSENIKLFTKISLHYEKKFGAKKQYIHKEKSYINVLTLSPNNFYNYAKNHDKYRPYMSKFVYDSYQIYNMLMLEETEELAKKYKWIKTSKLESRYHNIGTKKYVNKKYLVKDFHKGYLEAIYDEKGKLVFDGINDGTYNHYFYQHMCHNLDFFWWLLHGVYGKNKLTFCDRVKIII